MAGELGVRILRERSGTAFDVPEFPIEAREFLPQVDDAKIHEAAAGGTAMLFGGCHEPLAHPGALKRGIH